jgi:hypothetical protein
MPRRQPRLPELTLRLIGVGALLVVAAHLLQSALIRPLLPVFGGTVVLLAPQFTLQSLDLVPAQAPMVRARANLLEPVEFAGHTAVPIGWLGQTPQGGFEVSQSLTGLLQYPTLVMLIVLAWPASDLAILILRVAIGLAMAALLLLCEAPMTIVAELWSLVRDQAAPGAACFWMIWSRFLMGGGGLLIAGILGATAVIVAQRKDGAPSQPSDHRSVIFHG